MILQDKVAIITGSTSGIGEATAELFAREGASVVVSGRDIKRGVEIKRKIGNNSSFISCEMSKENDIKHLIEETVRLYGKIDILINNAATFLTLSLEDMTTEIWDYMFNVNTKSCFLMSKYCMPYLIDSKGVVVNNASVAGLQSYASGQSYSYSSSKSAVIQLSRVLALNYAKYGVRVNSICPGIIQTPVYKKDVSDSVYKIPLGKIGRPEEVADLILFLASDKSSYITGATIPIDGGLTI